MTFFSHVDLLIFIINQVLGLLIKSVKTSLQIATTLEIRRVKINLKNYKNVQLMPPSTYFNILVTLCSDQVQWSLKIIILLRFKKNTNT